MLAGTHEDCRAVTCSNEFALYGVPQMQYALRKKLIYAQTQPYTQTTAFKRTNNKTRLFVLVHTDLARLRGFLHQVPRCLLLPAVLEGELGVILVVLLENLLRDNTHLRLFITGPLVSRRHGSRLTTLPSQDMWSTLFLNHEYLLLRILR